METPKNILVGVTDVFFYTKIRDAFKPAGYTLERIRKQEKVIEQADALKPMAVILNMNDDRLNAFQTLSTLKGEERFQTLPVLAFANHEEVDTFRQAKELGISKIVSRNEFSARTLALLEEITAGVPTE
jgi:PleD family two-component response regulator